MRAIPASQSCHVLLELCINAAAAVCVSPAAERRDRIASGEGELMLAWLATSGPRGGIQRKGAFIVGMRNVLS